MDINLLIAFIGSSVLLTIMPGPDNIFVLTQTLTRGAKTGFLISVGLVSGIVVHTLLAATGLSILLQQSELLYSLILYAGALYLFYLAFMASKKTPLVIELDDKSIDTPEWSKLVRTGFFMNVLNPKVTLFFLAFLPTFITKDAWPVPLQFSILGFSFLVQALIIFSLISIVAGKLNNYLKNENFWKLAKWVKVAILAGLAVYLIL